MAAATIRRISAASQIWSIRPTRFVADGYLNKRVAVLDADTGR
jgi:hypothetical protein